MDQQAERQTLQEVHIWKICRFTVNYKPYCSKQFRREITSDGQWCSWHKKKWHMYVIMSYVTLFNWTIYRTLARASILFENYDYKEPTVRKAAL